MTYIILLSNNMHCLLQILDLNFMLSKIRPKGIMLKYIFVAAERIILYMFLRYRLKWDALKFSIYSTYNIIAHSLGEYTSAIIPHKSNIVRMI